MVAAFAALLSLKNNLNLIQNHPLHSFSFEPKQIQTLKETVSFLIEFMRSYDNSHGASKRAAEALEMRIARAAEAAEDVVETHVVDQIRSGKTRTSDTCPRARFLLDLQKVTQDLEYIRRKAINIKVEAEQEQEQEHSAPVPLTSNITIATTKMVGFDDVLLKLLDQLTGVPSSRKVISIVGMGGIGKTTLATNAFQHPLIVQRFDVCLWATISQQINVEKILTQLVSGLRKIYTKSFDASASYNTAVAEELGEVLYKCLCGQRYLIVLDDMWNVEAWDAIRFFFPETNDGSRIVVTTRLLQVAYHLSSTHLAMSFLDEGKSWDLFCQEAFEPETGCPSELEEIGKKIVGKCNGLPLAIVVVGGRLKKSSMAPEYWENVAQDMNSIMNSTWNEEERCFAILALSYSQLPVHLKPCLLLIGSCPEDELIGARDFYKLWISEGLIEPNENTPLEAVGTDYLFNLYQRNLILTDIYMGAGNVRFKVHDLVREMCMKIAKKENFLSMAEGTQAMNRERRVVISGEVAHMNQQSKSFDDPIRCLMYKGGWPSYNMKLLRTLKRVVPASSSVCIFKLVNLRHLKIDLGSTTLGILYLPSSISQLWNLQILTIVLPAHSKVIAPYEMWEMLQLRYVEINSVCLLDPLPVGGLDNETNDLVLKNLLTLGCVENFRLSEEVCKRVPNVTNLSLSYSDESSSYYCPHNLCYFQKLENFLCSFPLSSQSREFALSLTFPSSIKSLYLCGCGVGWEELTMMVGSLPHLNILTLSYSATIGEVWTTVEGKFPSLEHLEIVGCVELVYWITESSHFPVLKTLLLEKLYILDKFPLGIGEIPTLELITIKDCSMLSTASAMKILKEQEEVGNEDLRLLISFKWSGDEDFQDKVLEAGLMSKNLFLDVKKEGSSTVPYKIEFSSLFFSPSF